MSVLQETFMLMTVSRSFHVAVFHRYPDSVRLEAVAIDEVLHGTRWLDIARLYGLQMILNIIMYSIQIADVARSGLFLWLQRR